MSRLNEGLALRSKIEAETSASPVTLRVHLGLVLTAFHLQIPARLFAIRYCYSYNFTVAHLPISPGECHWLAPEHASTAEPS
jgi:hypothetical protein